MDSTPLKYNDENDRSLGLTGMAIAMFALDGEQFVASISIDAPSGQGIVLAPEFRFNGNPSFSAKLVWNQLLRQFELAAAMVMGNAMCRSYVGRYRRLDNKVEKFLRTIIDDEGKASCQLDRDETRRIFDKTYDFLDRLFNHSTVASTAQQLATALREQRSLSSAEINDLLSPLAR